MDKKTNDKVLKLKKELAATIDDGLILPGTLIKRYMKCTRAQCACKTDETKLHGPYWSWTRKIDNKTNTKYLSENEAEIYQPYFEKSRKIRKLLAELEKIGLAQLENTLEKRKTLD